MLYIVVASFENIILILIFENDKIQNTIKTCKYSNSDFSLGSNRMQINPVKVSGEVFKALKK